MITNIFSSSWPCNSFPTSSKLKEHTRISLWFIHRVKVAPCKLDRYINDPTRAYSVIFRMLSDDPTPPPPSLRSTHLIVLLLQIAVLQWYIYELLFSSFDNIYCLNCIFQIKSFLHRVVLSQRDSRLLKPKFALFNKSSSETPIPRALTLRSDTSRYNDNSSLFWNARSSPI